MAEEITQDTPELESTILSEEEAQTVVEGGEQEPTVELPSDTPKFELPEKFQGKSPEEIAKAYLELEKKLGQTDPKEEEGKGGDDVSAVDGEDKPEDDGTPKESKEIDIAKYEQKLATEGALSEEDYSELAEAGFTKEQVDEQIEYRAWKAEKAIKSVLDPIGLDKEAFKELSQWVASTKAPEEVQAINETLAKSPVIAQQALIKGLYSEFSSAGITGPIHTGEPQVQSSKGYTNESEFFADIGKPEYRTDRNYAKAVEAKLAKSDTTNWSF